MTSPARWPEAPADIRTLTDDLAVFEARIDLLMDEAKAAFAECGKYDGGAWLRTHRHVADLFRAELSRVEALSGGVR